MSYKERIYTRMTTEQKEKFEYLAYKSIMSPSEYLRNIIERGEIDEESFNQWKIKRNEGKKRN